MSERALVPRRSAAPASHGVSLPTIIAGAGERAARRLLEFFAATIRNKVGGYSDLAAGGEPPHRPS